MRNEIKIGDRVALIRDTQGYIKGAKGTVSDINRGANAVCVKFDDGYTYHLWSVMGNVARINKQLSIQLKHEDDTPLFYFDNEKSIYAVDELNLTDFDCPNIAAANNGTKITEDQLHEAIDTILLYLKQEGANSLNLDVTRYDFNHNAKKMTLEEIEEELGYRVEIVGNKEEDDA